MTLMEVLEVSSEDIPMNKLGGAGKRRVKLYIRGKVSDAGSDTINMITYVPTMTDIEGIEFGTTRDALNATAAGSNYTWTTSVLTVVNAGTAEMCIVGTLT